MIMSRYLNRRSDGIAGWRTRYKQASVNWNLVGMLSHQSFCAERVSVADRVQDQPMLHIAQLQPQRLFFDFGRIENNGP